MATVVTIDVVVVGVAIDACVAAVMGVAGTLWAE
jgi:hypothetical protein